MFNLRALQHAIAVADCGSFVAAARIVHLSQPALSRSVQGLERSIGIRIFDRLGGGVRPTDAGVLFLERARPLLATAEALALDAGRFRRAGETDFVVGAATYCAEGLVDLAVARLVRTRDRPRIGIVTDHWANLFHSLRRQEVSLVVADTTMAESDPTLHVEPLSRAQGLLAVRPGNPLAGRPQVTLADVMRHPVVTTSRVTSRVMEPLLKAAPQEQRADFAPVVCESIAMMKRIAMGSDAVAILPMRALFDEVASGKLVLLPIRPPWLHGRFGVVRLRDHDHSESALQFLEVLREVDRETDARARAEEDRLLGNARPAGAGKRTGRSRSRRAG